MTYDDKVASICERQKTGELGYAEALDALVDTYVKRRTLKTSLAPMLSLLGCRNVRSRTENSPWIFEEPAQPSAEQEPVVIQNLLVALRLYIEEGRDSATDNSLALIDGLARNNRWRACLETVEDANRLALLLLQAAMWLNVLERSRDNQICWLARTSEPALYEILNAWAQPGQAFTSASTIAPMACALFGDIWFDFTFGGERWFAAPSSRTLTENNYAILRSIATTMPPFLPKLLAPHVCQQVGLALPSMGI